MLGSLEIGRHYAVAVQCNRVGRNFKESVCGTEGGGRESSMPELSSLELSIY